MTTTTAELRAAIKRVLPFYDAAEGVAITISGYESDARELWDIPEVCAFARSLVAEGFLGVMKVPSSAAPGATTEYSALNGLGVFLMSRGIALNNTVITAAVMEEYCEAIRAANALISARYASDGRIDHELGGGRTVTR